MSCVCCCVGPHACAAGSCNCFVRLQITSADMRSTRVLADIGRTLQDIRSSQRQLAATQRQLAAKLDFFSIDVKNKMRPSSSQESQGRDRRFRIKLMKTYDNQPDGEGKMKCMVTGWMVPAEAIRAGHLFPMRLQVGAAPVA